MRTETASIEIAKPADEVWALVGEFGGLDTWMAGVDSCTVDGDVRTIQTMGMEIQEELISRDAGARAITYGMIGEGAPVEQHRATITVAEAGAGASRVTWEVSVTPDDAAEMFKGIYQGALDRLKARVES